jgi:RNA polymerase sigma-70 factor, ECF subfamily
MSIRDYPPRRKSRVDQQPVQAGHVEVEKDLRARLLELYASSRPALLSYIRQLVRSTAEAEDIVQSAFLKTFDLAREQQIDNLRAWLYRVAHNLAIDALRRRKLQEQAVSEWVYTKPAETSPSVEQSSINRQTVERALSLLNDRERSCLLLRAEGLSYAEIGQVLEISAKSVSVYLTRGVKKMRSES